MKLHKYKIEVELCAPDHIEPEEVMEYMNSLVRESDVAAENDVFAIGTVVMIDDADTTVDEWNGDAPEED